MPFASPFDCAQRKHGGLQFVLSILTVRVVVNIVLIMGWQRAVRLFVQSTIYCICLCCFEEFQHVK